MEITNPRLLDLMQRYMDFSVRKQEVISSNLANADTPGYQARDVSFDQQLAFEMDGPWLEPTARHFSDKPTLLRPRVVARQSPGALGNDLNNVDADHEMVSLAQNLLKFSAVSQMYQKKIEMLKYSIREGK